MKEEARGTHRVEVARTEGSAVFEHLVEAFLHGGQLVRLHMGGEHVQFRT